MRDKFETADETSQRKLDAASSQQVARLAKPSDAYLISLGHIKRYTGK